jgi:hypothetical protein
MHEQTRRICGWMLGVLGAIGCGPAGPGTPQADTGESTGGAGGTTGDAETAGPTSGVVGSTSSAGSAGSAGSTSDGSSGPGSTSGVDGSSGGGVTFIVDHDQGGDPWCDVWAQDCPRGEKCTPYANDGGSSWNALKCVPVMEDPAGEGEPCFVVDNGVSGIDNCELGAYCWNVDEENNGNCVALCIGTPESPTCPDPENTYCAITGDGVINLCLATCDPLLQDCKAGEVCIYHWDDSFGCVFDASGEEGQAHDPCEFVNACDPGLICLYTQSAVECDAMASGCCEPYCDLTLPNTCPGMGQVCTPLFEAGMAPPGLEDVGYCALPD